MIYTFVIIITAIIITHAKSFKNKCNDFVWWLNTKVFDLFKMLCLHFLNKVTF